MRDNPKDNELKNIETVLTDHDECYCGGGSATPHRAGVAGCYLEKCPDNEAYKYEPPNVLRLKGIGRLHSGEWVRLKSHGNNSMIQDVEW